MKIAAIQMETALGDVDANLESARRLVKAAFEAGAEWVILPEFFPTAMGFSPKMDQAARPVDGEPARLLLDLARIHGGVVGGSFIARLGADCVNRFILALPDGTSRFHDKDQPTMWENAYYVGGSDDGLFDTPVGAAGVAMCWEMVRSRTARRLCGRVDLVVGGSCWWSLPEKRLPGFSPALAARMERIMEATPAALARMVGAPVIHAAHAGRFSGRLPLVPGFPYDSHFLGETQIVDAHGRVLARRTRQEGEGFILAEVTPGRIEPRSPVPDRFWIPRIPWLIRLAWAYQNAHGRRYYRRKNRPA
ncbi:MAG: carbon-nitrogen hydrolase family protein [Proteobacteria bacterium]|nr:carbon-nitrogen hydrolase family protein [Pseudomonadota bacterium]